MKGSVMMLPSPPITPPLKPQLRVDIPSWTVSLSTPSTSPPYDSASSQGSSLIPDTSTRGLLLYTIGMLPDHVLSPSSWRTHSLSMDKASPMTVYYLVPETSVSLQVTGYANDQYVVRLLGQKGPSGEMGNDSPSPLIAVCISGHQHDGISKDVPAWKVRETLMERIQWNKNLD
jgi:hypothetical protein